MRKATEASASDGKALKFQQIVKADLRQEFVHDFVSYTTDGNCITLLGSKLELVTLELTSKTNYHVQFPYIVNNFKCLSKDRPLDVLSQQVDLQQIYENSNVLEMQQLSLDAAYSAPCSQDVPDPKLMAACLSTRPLPNGQMLLASLNSYGALHLLTKDTAQPQWVHYKLGVDVAATLRDKLQPTYEVPVAKIDTFRRYQAFIDRSWITMFAWRSVDATSANHVLVLGTAAGSIWTLTLSADAKTVVAHSELHTLLGRICYLHCFENLLLVGDNNGLVHLYKFTDAEEDGIVLVKTLWLRPDHMGLQQALITNCPERKCYYIACCKAAHLLIWCMPRKETNSWLETRLHVGGMKITGLCALENYSYALATARGPIYRIELIHKYAQLSASMQPIEIDDSENFQPFGLCSSPQKHLLIVLHSRNNEYLLNKTVLRNQLMVRVGKLNKHDALTQLASCLTAKEAINGYIDLLADVRIEIFNRHESEKYANYAPLDMFAFDELATDEQLQQLQLKYHVMEAISHVQRSQLQSVEHSVNDMQLLLAMLVLTHIRLRLQYLSSLKKLTAFQRKASQCLLTESARIRQQLEQLLLEEHSLNATIKRFLGQMEVHFDALQRKFGTPKATDDAEQQQPARCCISFVEITLSLDRHYCSICDRQILLEQQLLKELYAANSTLLCPCCHGSYILERFDA